MNRNISISKGFNRFKSTITDIPSDIHRSINNKYSLITIINGLEVLCVLIRLSTLGQINGFVELERKAHVLHMSVAKWQALHAWLISVHQTGPYLWTEQTILVVLFFY